MSMSIDPAILNNAESFTGDKMLFRNTKELLPSTEFYIADM